MKTAKQFWEGIPAHQLYKKSTNKKKAIKDTGKFDGKSKQILDATHQVEDVSKLKVATYKHFAPLMVPESVSCAY